jgi:hypothetical protein
MDRRGSGRPDRAARRGPRSVAQDHPAEVLRHAATGAQLPVVGSRGHGTFAGALLGSVALDPARTRLGRRRTAVTGPHPGRPGPVRRCGKPVAAVVHAPVAGYLARSVPRAGAASSAEA